jgi:hypothetical protein
MSDLDPSFIAFLLLSFWVWLTISFMVGFFSTFIFQFYQMSLQREILHLFWMWLPFTSFFSYFILTSVACAIRPSVNPLQNRETQHLNIVFAMYVSMFWTAKYERKSCLNWMVSLQMLPHSQLIFPSKTWLFEKKLNFQWQKSLKNQYIPHSKSKSYQINSIKSCSSRSFQQHQRRILILPKFPTMI